MLHVKIGILVIFGIIGIWLCFWDLIDFMTKGFNTGVWNVSIVQNGLPSIFVGMFIIIICMVLGVKVIKLG